MYIGTHILFEPIDYCEFSKVSHRPENMCKTIYKKNILCSTYTILC